MKTMKGQTNQFSNKRVIFGGHSPVPIPKPRLYFQRVTDKKAAGHHPTKEKVPEIVMVLGIPMPMEASLLRKQVIYKHLC